MSTGTAEIEKQVSIDRYPGIRPFRKGEGGLFFGRNKEIKELLDSIKVYDTLVLYSKSGLGKSSLVNAGLAPRLLQDNLFPIDVRFLTTADKNPYKKILSEVKHLIPKEVLKAIPEKLQDNLWVLFSQWQLPQTPVLIFDQFEEFFYYDADLQTETISQVADLMNAKVAENVIRKIAALNHDDEEYVLNLLKKPNVKLLFLIRSDRLSMLEALSTKLPQILSNRYHLKPLGIEKAEQAISLPAQLLLENEEVVFKSQPYEYSIESLKIILRSLSNKNDEIESSQLQIVCQELEKIAESKWEREGREVIMEPEDFDGEKGIKKIINDFYWNQLKKLRNNEELQLSNDDIIIIRNLIENELLSSNKRIIQSADRVRDILTKVKPGVQKIGNVDKASFLVDALLQLRLIREEDSHLGKVFEISHDTLVESIVNAREERVKDEQAAKLLEQQKELEEERKRTADETRLKEKAQRARKNLRILLLFMLVLLIGMVYLLINANNSRIRNRISNVNELIRKENYEEAKKALGYEKAISGLSRFINLSALDTFSKLNNEINKKIIISARFDSLMALAGRYKETASKGDSLVFAHSAYTDAEKLGYVPGDPDKKARKHLEEIKTEITTAFIKHVTQAEAFYIAGDKQDAKIAFCKAASLSRVITIDQKSLPHRKFQELEKFFVCK